MKKPWEYMCLILLGVPMVLVGYLGTFMLNGLVTGHRLYNKLHNPEADE